MRHSRINGSKRHKKLKTISGPSKFNYVEDEVLRMNKEQPISAKLAQIIEFKKTNSGAKQSDAKNDVPAKSFKKKLKKALNMHKTLIVKSEAKVPIEKGMTRAPKAIPEKVEKGFLENDYQFLNRIDRMVSKAMAEAKLEEHFEIDLAGQINEKDDAESEKQSPFQSESEREKALKRKNKRKLKDIKRKEKKCKKKHKLQKLEESKQFAFRKEQIKFGEVVHQPPSIIRRKKKCK